MMTLSSRVAATAVASLLLMGSALAQTPAPAPPAATAAPRRQEGRKAAHRGIPGMLQGS
jgi:hypothetical protein